MDVAAGRFGVTFTLFFILICLFAFVLFYGGFFNAPAGRFSGVGLQVSCTSNSDCDSGFFCLEAGGVRRCTGVEEMPECVDEDGGSIFVPGRASGVVYSHDFKTGGDVYVIGDAESFGQSEVCRGDLMLDSALIFEPLCNKLPEGFSAVEVSMQYCPENQCNSQGNACACKTDEQCGRGKKCVAGDCV